MSISHPLTLRMIAMKLLWWILATPRKISKYDLCKGSATGSHAQSPTEEKPSKNKITAEQIMQFRKNIFLKVSHDGCGHRSGSDSSRLLL